MIQEKIEIDKAELTTYILDNYPEIDLNRKRPAVVICPGGAYKLLSDTETESIAVKMMSLGFHAFILRYSIKPVIFPQSLIELAKSMQVIRRNAEKWNIDENKIIVAGFSAGGHLAASLGVFWNEAFLKEQLFGNEQEWKPNGLLLCYPVITSGPFAHGSSLQNLLGENYDKLKVKMSLENQITKDTPATFIWHTVEDQSVPVENSLLFANKLQSVGVPFELHIFPKGIHGLSLATSETTSDPQKIDKAVSNWPWLFKIWVTENL
ncbi:alpha/beta hydrolase [Enterococcus xiangfangensis]|uniref:alpha/beta hydrolase n=1 Tax=Enterococcus xiangfangensis TaxID=1296537 RepID=UPI0010F679FA|nr:alpha/beta hydrolase [Enterococcus xiangfangensis]MBM7712355.1 acetyl esterase/lipase [Enterococcus xiangfangensis]NBK08968.1 alpha/beta hydrolase [Enterococcus asini]